MDRRCGPDSRRDGDVVPSGPSGAGAKKPARGGLGVGPSEDQLARAPRARAVMSSTEPVPLMARYLGAAAGSDWAQVE